VRRKLEIAITKNVKGLLTGLARAFCSKICLSAKVRIVDL